MTNDSLIDLINNIQQIRGKDDYSVWHECEHAKAVIAVMGEVLPVNSGAGRIQSAGEIASSPANTSEISRNKTGSPYTQEFDNIGGTSIAPDIQREILDNEDAAMLEKQNSYLEQYKGRGMEFMLAATMIYQRAWQTRAEMTAIKPVSGAPALELAKVARAVHVARCSHPMQANGYQEYDKALAQHIIAAHERGAYVG